MDFQNGGRSRTPTRQFRMTADEIAVVVSGGQKKLLHTLLERGSRLLAQVDAAVPAHDLRLSSVEPRNSAAEDFETTEVRGDVSSSRLGCGYRRLPDLRPIIGHARLREPSSSPSDGASRQPSVEVTTVFRASIRRRSDVWRVNVRRDENVGGTDRAELSTQARQSTVRCCLYHSRRKPTTAARAIIGDLLVAAGSCIM